MKTWYIILAVVLFVAAAAWAAGAFSPRLDRYVLHGYNEYSLGPGCGIDYEIGQKEDRSIPAGLSPLLNGYYKCL